MGKITINLQKMNTFNDDPRMIRNDRCLSLSCPGRCPVRDCRLKHEFAEYNLFTVYFESLVTI